MIYDIDYFRAIQGSSGFNNEKEAKVAEIQRQFAEDFDSSVGVEYEVTRNNIRQDFIISPSETDGVCTIFSRPNETFYIGDTLHWNGMHWLVTDKKHQNSIFPTGTISRCNRLITWQNAITKEVIKRWCIVSKRSFTGVDEGNVVSTLNGRIQIKVPFDDETLAVNTDKRFMLDVVGGIPMCYRLTFPDVNTYRYHEDNGGLIEWELVSDMYDSNVDNKSLMICDYSTLSPALPPIKPPMNVLSSQVLGRKDIRIGGIKRTYTAKFFDYDGVTEIKTAVPKWELIVDEDIRQYFKLIENGYSADLLAIDTEQTIGKSLKIRLSDSKNQHSSSEIQIECVVK